MSRIIKIERLTKSYSDWHVTQLKRTLQLDRAEVKRLRGCQFFRVWKDDDWGRVVTSESVLAEVANILKVHSEEDGRSTL